MAVTSLSSSVLLVAICLTMTVVQAMKVNDLQKVDRASPGDQGRKLLACASSQECGKCEDFNDNADNSCGKVYDNDDGVCMEIPAEHLRIGKDGNVVNTKSMEEIEQLPNQTPNGHTQLKIPGRWRDGINPFAPSEMKSTYALGWCMMGGKDTDADMWPRKRDDACPQGAYCYCQHPNLCMFNHAGTGGIEADKFFGWCDHSIDCAGDEYCQRQTPIAMVHPDHAWRAANPLTDKMCLLDKVRTTKENNYDHYDEYCGFKYGLDDFYNGNILLSQNGCNAATEAANPGRTCMNWAEYKKNPGYGDWKQSNYQGCKCVKKTQCNGEVTRKYFDVWQEIMCTKNAQGEYPADDQGRTASDEECAALQAVVESMDEFFKALSPVIRAIVEPIIRGAVKTVIPAVRKISPEAARSLEVRSAQAFKTATNVARRLNQFGSDEAEETSSSLIESRERRQQQQQQQAASLVEDGMKEAASSSDDYKKTHKAAQNGWEEMKA